MAPRIFVYGLRPPIQGGDTIAAQFKQAHRYRNMLIEIERDRRKEASKILSHHPDVDGIRAELEAAIEHREAARASMQAGRKQARRRNEAPEVRTAIRDLGARIKEIRTRLNDAKQALIADASVKGRLTELDLRARARVKEERAKFSGAGLYWGTYLLQEAAADAARKGKGMPEFVRESRGGRIGVQLQGGIDLKDLWGTDTQLRIDPVDPKAYDVLSTKRGDRRRLSRTMLSMRIGSDEKKKPIWAKFPMIMHRPLPEGSTIKAATVISRPHDCRMMTWEVHILVDTPESWRRRAVPEFGMVAINLGFSRRSDGSLRAGYVVGSDGYEKEIVLPMAGVIDPIQKSESLQSIRDKNFDAMKETFVPLARALREDHFQKVQQAVLGWSDLGVGTNTPDELDVGSAPNWRVVIGESFKRMCLYIDTSERGIVSHVPHWFVRGTTYAHSWKSLAKIRDFTFRWRKARFKGDEEAHDVLEKWRYRDEHLERYESGMRKRAINHRRELYRLLTCDLARRYRHVVVEDTNLSDMQRSPSPESETVEITQVKYAQRLVAGSLLRQIAVNGFEPQYAITVETSNITRTCAQCGAINELDRQPGKPRVVSCTTCLASWDQDANACINMLRRAKEQLAAPPESVTKKPARSQILRRRKKGGDSVPSQPTDSPTS